MKAWVVQETWEGEYEYGFQGLKILCHSGLREWDGVDGSLVWFWEWWDIGWDSCGVFCGSANCLKNIVWVSWLTTHVPRLFFSGASCSTVSTYIIISWGLFCFIWG